jgi:RNA polymerase sigma-70 factor, ECF subfamily
MIRNHFQVKLNVSTSTSPLQDATQLWSPIVESLMAGEPADLEQVYKACQTLRYYLYRRIGPEHAEDAYHDVVVGVSVALKRYAVQKPESLESYARAVAYRTIVKYVRGAIRGRTQHLVADDGLLRDPSSTPEEAAISSQNRAIAASVLKELSERDRQVLIRFYIREESAEEIQREMKLTPTQFRLIKSRAKARFGELGKAAMAARSHGPKRDQ